MERITIAAIHASLGNLDAAFESLAHEPAHAWLPWVGIMPEFEPLLGQLCPRGTSTAGRDVARKLNEMQARMMAEMMALEATTRALERATAPCLRR